jgi:hypothetical protein
MIRKGVYTTLVMALVLVLVSSATVCARIDQEEPVVIPDLILAKPVGFAALVVGTVTYVVTLPVTLPLGWQARASESLVKQPYRFTFQRNLGEGLEGP